MFSIQLSQKSVNYMRHCSFIPSFMPIHTGAETDLRFIYCAGKRMKLSNETPGHIFIDSDHFPFCLSAAVCFMLEDWSGMDREKAKNYILNCQVCPSAAVLLLYQVIIHYFFLFHIVRI